MESTHSNTDRQRSIVAPLVGFAKLLRMTDAHPEMVEFTAMSLGCNDSDYYHKSIFKSLRTGIARNKQNINYFK
jgi:hypothetical protein